MPVSLRKFARKRVVPLMLRVVGVAPAPATRFLAGQRALTLRSIGVETVLDVGANTGQYVAELRAAGYKGVIHSFEPGREAYTRLSERAATDARWHVHNLALGVQKGEVDFHVWEGDASAAASVRQPTEAMEHLLGEATTYKVPVDTLETWLAAHPRVDPRASLLKIDVQGSEREVLLGAGQRLADFAMLEVEGALGELYHEEAALEELLVLTKGHGFVPTSIMTERFHAGWVRAVDVDVLLLRSDLVGGPR